MNKAGQIAVAVLILALGAAIGIRLLRSPASSSPAPPPTPAEPHPPAPPAARMIDDSCGSIALRWIALLQEQAKSAVPGGPSDELTRSRERELHQDLAKRLGEDPSRWTDVLEALSEEDPRLGRKIVAQLQDAVGEAGEKPLIALVRSGRHRETRMASATLIGGRNSPDAFWTLVSCAQEDADGGVRYQALSELVKRKGRAGLDQESETIDQLLRLRAQIDPDPGTRNFALRVTGQSPATASMPPPPPTKRILRTP